MGQVYAPLGTLPAITQIATLVFRFCLLSPAKITEPQKVVAGLRDLLIKSARPERQSKLIR